MIHNEYDILEKLFYVVFLKTIALSRNIKITPIFLILLPMYYTDLRIITIIYIAYDT